MTAAPMMPGVLEKLDGLEKKLDRMRAADSALWDWQTIAEFIGYETAVARRKLQNDPHFPRPVIMPGGGKRYRAEEVKQYLKSLPRG